MAITNEVLELYKLILDPPAAMVDFTHLRWFRSITGATGPFAAITAASAAAARLTGTHLEPHALNGKTLSLRVNGDTDINIEFAGTDPYTTADVIADILAETVLVVASDDGETQLRLTTAATGTGASIEILESDGALALGFVTGQFAIGLDADDELDADIHEYRHSDSNGSRDFWYRTQLVNGTTLGQSTVPFPGTLIPVIAYSLTIAAYVRLIDLRGRPIEGRRVIISNVFLPNTVGNYNIFRHSDSFLTDETGYGELRLLRSAVIDVHVEGTSYTRRITLPSTDDTTDIVNLFDPSLSTEDEFGIQEPNIDFAVRLS